LYRKEDFGMTPGGDLSCTISIINNLVAASSAIDIANVNAARPYNKSVKFFLLLLDLYQEKNLRVIIPIIMVANTELTPKTKGDKNPVVLLKRMNNSIAKNEY
jgi:predicted class III extradiol MEMO1 family dioxygenase